MVSTTTPPLTQLPESFRPLRSVEFHVEYWVIDLVRGCVHVHRDPSADGWGSVVRHDRGSLSATALLALTIDVSEALLSRPGR